MDNFNTSLPIPKSKEISRPADYRPISISTPMCTIFELLLEMQMPFLEHQHENQWESCRLKSFYYGCKERFQENCQEGRELDG